MVAKGRIRRGGFTLLELLIVIIILTMLTAMAAVASRKMLQNMELNNALDVVVSSIGTARDMAITKNQIIHVRLENLGFNNQWLSIYRFPRTADALNIATEKDVCAVAPTLDASGWNVGPSLKREDEDGTFIVYTNERILRRQLPEGTFFETEYDPAKLWDESKAQLRKPYDIHSIANSMYFPQPLSAEDVAANKSLWAEPFYPSVDQPINTVPRVTGSTETHQLLSFYPDGTASANIVILLRDADNLRYVKVFKGGQITGGSISTDKELKNVLEL